jgi:hypothetical protein
VTVPVQGDPLPHRPDVYHDRPRLFHRSRLCTVAGVPARLLCVGLSDLNLGLLPMQAPRCTLDPHPGGGLEWAS